MTDEKFEKLGRLAYVLANLWDRLSIDSAEKLMDLPHDRVREMRFDAKNCRERIMTLAREIREDEERQESKCATP